LNPGSKRAALLCALAFPALLATVEAASALYCLPEPVRSETSAWVPFQVAGRAVPGRQAQTNPHALLKRIRAQHQCRSFDISPSAQRIPGNEGVRLYQ